MNEPGIGEVAAAFDHWAPALAADPHPVYRRLRDECPVARSDQHSGFWVVSRHAEVDAAARDAATFSSTAISIPVEIGLGGLPLPPLDQDPPEHTRFRRLLLPFFSPGRTAKLEPVTRAMASGLIDRFASRGTFDASDEYAKPLPIAVLGQILGVPTDDEEQFGRWILQIVEGGATDADAAAQAGAEIYGYFVHLLDERREHGRDDLLTFLLEAEVDGERMTDEERLGCAVLLLIAGIDTTWSTLGSSLWYLAQQPEVRRRLVGEPALMGTAVEELLRVFAPTSVARIATRDTELGGCPIAAGDPLLLVFPSANRDEREFSDPDAVVLDRAPNRHVAFGAGIHRCIGAHLARMELRVGLEELLRRIPDFRLADDEAVAWKAGPIRGPRRLALVVD